MFLLDIFFTVLSILYVLCSLMVVFSKNPVHSVLYLILIFIITICFFFLLGVEYLSFVFLIIYIGAIAVLFLFIVMMLNIKMIEYNETFLKYLPISGLLFIVSFLELSYIFDVNLLANINIYDSYNLWVRIYEDFNPLFIIAFVLYTYYFHLLILAGLLLLLAMIGSIMLTLTNIHRAYKDDVYKKVSQNLKNSLQIININKKIKD